MGLLAIHGDRYCIDGFRRVETKEKENTYYKTTTQSRVPNLLSTSLPLSLSERTTALKAAVRALAAPGEVSVNRYRYVENGIRVDGQKAARNGLYLRAVGPRPEKR